MEAVADNLFPILRETSLFSAWPEDLLHTLLLQSKKVTLDSGEILFGHLEKPSHFGCI